MCDEHSVDDANRHPRNGGFTRRQFGALSVGTGVAILLPRAASALEVTSAAVDVPTPDGTADCFFVHPSTGKHPGVMMLPDARGIRRSYHQMATRLAESGYSVVVLNPYYRTKRAPILAEGAQVEDPGVLETLRPLMASLNATTHVTDTTALAAFLDKQPSVNTTRKLGAMGYCMGGPMIMRAAAAMPERIGACASFHGAGLVTNRPDSPHLLVPKMKAPHLFAIAEGDDARDPEAKSVLRESFAAANLAAEIEVYPGTMHGWCPPDGVVYNETQAERAWSRTMSLFEAQLA
jgi:carboxymethylenebutenolidase